jgi:hypothetical protein
VVEAHLYVVLGPQGFDPADVGHGGPGEEAVAVAGREGVAVTVEELGPEFFPALLDQGVVQVVRPRAGRLDEAFLDIVHVVVRDLARPGVDDEVEAREHGFGEPDVELDVHAA